MSLEQRVPLDLAAEVHKSALEYWLAYKQGARGQNDVPIAHHALGARRPLLAAEAQVACGWQEAGRHRPGVAYAHFTRALEILDESQLPDSQQAKQARLEALRGCGWAGYRVDRASEAALALEKARSLAVTLHDAQAEALSLLECATALDWAQRFSESSDKVREAAGLAVCQSDALCALRLELGLGRNAWRAGQLAQALIHLPLAAAAAAAAHDDDTRIVALLLLGPALVVDGQIEQAKAQFAELFALCESHHDRLHLCAAHGNRMFLWSAVKEPGRAREDLRHAMRLARQIGHPGPERIATYNLAEDLYWSGEDDRESLLLARRSRELANRFVEIQVAEDALLVARSALAGGDLDEVQSMIEWVEKRVGAQTLQGASKLFYRMLKLCISSSQTKPTWKRLLGDAQGLEGDDHLEFLYWALRVGPSGLVDIPMCKGLLAAHVIWQRRFEELGVLCAG